MMMRGGHLDYSIQHETDAKSHGDQALDDAAAHIVAFDPGPVCTENSIRVDDVIESPKLAE